MKPEVFDGPDYRHKLVEVHRLGDIAVSVEVIGLREVLFRVGCGQHHHRDAAQIRVAFYLLKNLAAAFAGQIQIEQDKVRPDGIFVGTAPLEEIHSFDAVMNHTQIVNYATFFQSLFS